MSCAASAVMQTARRAKRRSARTQLKESICETTIIQAPRISYTGALRKGEESKMDSVLGWLTVTAGVFYFFGVLFRQGVLELEERSTASERAWEEAGK